MRGQVLGQAVVINVCCLRGAINIAHEESRLAWMFESSLKAGVLFDIYRFCLGNVFMEVR